MKITVKFFAYLRDIVGKKDLEYNLPEEMNVSELVKRLQTEYSGLTRHIPRTIISVNREFAEGSTKVQDGDEVAFFPPVSGGGDDKFIITLEPISLDAVAAKVIKPATGAVALFGGIVRNQSADKMVDYLEYEAYEEMAVEKLQQVANESRQKWPDIVDIAIIQRIGHLNVGEMAVIVAVSSSHRGDGCFEACRYAINRLKQIVPIWKKEVGPDGSEWIEGDYLPSTPVL
jgi:molybdopterin synthase catalytic subunit